MAQPPYLLDVLQIEPGSGDTLTIARDSTAGAMEFVDAILTSGVLLPALVGLRNVTGLFVVGRAGDGAPYTTIQSAIDAIPVSSSATAPSVVLILSGVYTENLTLQRDGVCLVGVGGVTIANSGASDTITVSAATDSTPQNMVFRGLTVTNDQAAQACINILGADTFATATATVVNAPLATGDTLTIGGVALTGTAAARTSGSNDFWAGGGTVDAVAAEIVDAINDSANGFTAIATATSALGAITLTATTAGSGGNATTLASSTTWAPSSRVMRMIPGRGWHDCHRGLCSGGIWCRGLAGQCRHRGPYPCARRNLPGFVFQLALPSGQLRGFPAFRD